MRQGRGGSPGSEKSRVDVLEGIYYDVRVYIVMSGYIL